MNAAQFIIVMDKLTFINDETQWSQLVEINMSRQRHRVNERERERDNWERLI